jgi:hypothetical protein
LYHADTSFPAQRFTRAPYTAFILHDISQYDKMLYPAKGRACWLSHYNCAACNDIFRKNAKFGAVQNFPQFFRTDGIKNRSSPQRRRAIGLVLLF